MVFDGAPSDSIYAIDIVSHWEVGLDLFNDRDHFKARFLEVDLMAAETDANLKALQGKMDIISISAVFHQWNWRTQVDAAKKVLAFSKPGSLVVGHQIGSADAKEHKTLGQMQVDVWRHNPDSFVRMWDQVGYETGTKCKTEARLLSWEDIGWMSEDYGFMPAGDCILDFVVTRVE